MLFPQKINVVASARHANPHNETVVVQNDTAVEFYVAVVGDNGQTELPEGATYTLVCLHLRKQPTEKLGTLQADGNVMFKLTHMELSETGPVQGQVRVYHPVGGRLTSNPFIFHVAPDPTYGAEIKPEDQSIIEQVIGEGPAIIAEAKEETTKNITERARLTGAVDGALSSLADDKAQALLEMSQSKGAADQSAQVAQQAADNADDERERLTLEVSDKLNEVETARSATVEATGEATEAAGLARDEADAARLQKEEVQDILGAGPVASVNGETGVVTGLATQESMNQVTAQLAETSGEIQTLEAEKMDKTTMDISPSQINKNKGKFDQTYFTDEFLQQMTGDAPVNSTPADKSVTTQKLANSAVTGAILSDDLTKSVRVNLLDESKTIPTGYFSNTTGEWIVSGTNRSTDLIALKAGDIYTRTIDGSAAVGNVLSYWDASGNFISGETLSRTVATYQIPNNPDIAGIRLNIHRDSDKYKTMIVKGSELPNKYYAFNQKILDVKTENIEDRSITFPKISEKLLKNDRTNVLNERSTSLGGYYDWKTGEWIEAASFRSSDFIPCHPGEVFTRTLTPRVGNQITYWDKDKQFVVGNDIGSNTEQIFVPRVPNIAFLKTSIPSASDKNKTMFVKGFELPTRYISHDQEILRVSNENIEDNSISKNKISESLKKEIFNTDFIKPFNKVKNPVITADIVTDREGVTGVADPFIVLEKGRYHMFFETMGGLQPGTTNTTEEIAHAYSDDLVNWTYTQVVIGRNEKGHRSAYPHVFKVDGEWYMLPDTGGPIKLYKATNFPLEWEFQLDLISSAHLDTNVFKIGSVWYMTTYKISDADGVRLYYNDSGDWKNTNWTLHPEGIIIGNTGEGTGTKCAGNPRVFEDYVLLPIQMKFPGDPGNKSVYWYKLGNFSTSTVSVANMGVLAAPQLNGDWNHSLMHHVSHADYINGHIYVADGVGLEDPYYRIGLYVDN